MLKSVYLLPGQQSAENSRVCVCCQDSKEQKILRVFVAGTEERKILKSGFVAGGSDQQAVEKSPETSAPSPRSASHF